MFLHASPPLHSLLCIDALPTLPYVRRQRRHRRPSSRLCSINGRTRICVCVCILFVFLLRMSSQVCGCLFGLRCFFASGEAGGGCYPFLLPSRSAIANAFAYVDARREQRSHAATQCRLTVAVAAVRALAWPGGLCEGARGSGHSTNIAHSQLKWSTSGERRKAFEGCGLALG